MHYIFQAFAYISGISNFWKNYNPSWVTVAPARYDLGGMVDGLGLLSARWA